jgi:hypothetical protein
LHAAYAATALANLRVLDRSNIALNALLLHEDPLMATTAWQASLVVDCLPSSAQQVRPYQQALSRPEDNIRDAAIKSAIWTQQPWILPVLRQLASAGDSVAVQWLAIATMGEDGSLIVAQLKSIESPQSRCDILVRFGHPGVLKILRDWMSSDDAMLGSLSGTAFTRITSSDVRGERIQAPLNENADDFDREFVPLIWTADIKKVDAYMQQNSGLLNGAKRWSRGLSLEGTAKPETLAAIDLQIRWDQLARHRLGGDLSCQPEPIVY